MATKLRHVYGRVKTVPELISNMVDSFVEERLLISMPAIVTKVDNYETQQTVDIKGLIGTVYPDGDIVNPVNIKNVFVKLPSGGGYSIKIPVKVGDLVTVHWSHKSLDAFLSGKGEQVDETLSPVIDRHDCYVMLGFGTRFDNQKPSKTDFIIQGEKNSITLKPSGEIDIQGTDINITASDKVVVNAQTEVDITTPLAKFSQDVEIAGKLDVTGAVESSTGMFSPSYSGPSGGGGGTMTIDSATITTDATIGGISYLGHVHSDPQGGLTGPPQ